MVDRATRVLLVEDDEDDYILTQELLREALDSCYELSWIANYQDGLAVLAEETFDVCLVDYHIGDRTGLEFVQETAARGCVVPKILLTGTRDPGVDLAAAHTGAADYLDKAELTSRALDRSIRYAVRHAQDILKLKEAQNALCQAKSELETKVEERTQDLISLNESLKQEIAERRRAEAQLRHDAFHDRLTQLPSREVFIDRLTQAIRRVRRDPEKNFAVLLINIDRFKVINDALGHLAGDEILVMIADRFQTCLRESDTLSRTGGNDFALLLEDVSLPDGAIACAQRIKDVLTEPFLIDAQEVFCTVSVGISVSSHRYVTAENMLHDAALALGTAKRRDKDRFELFDISMRSHTSGLLKLDSDLRRAITRGGELELHYQPIVDLPTRRVAGFEALVRWRHPERGMISPADFIPLAEETGIVAAIGGWTLEEAAVAVKRWQEEFDDPIFVSVNISRKQLSDVAFADGLVEKINHIGLSPSNLKLEITESMLMNDPESAATLLNRLANFGFGLAMDDFGTGYSSLSYLREFPFDSLKIDRSLIRAMTDGAKDREIVTTIINLAEVLGMDVVAEGVETEDEIDCLCELGCRLAQGFYFAPGIPFREVRRMLATASPIRGLQIPMHSRVALPVRQQAMNTKRSEC